MYVIVDDHDAEGAVTVLTEPRPDKGDWLGVLRVPYGTDAGIPKGPGVHAPCGHRAPSRKQQANAYCTTVIRSAAGGVIGSVVEELAVRYCSKAARSSAPTSSFVPSPSVVKPSPPPARKLFDATR